MRLGSVIRACRRQLGITQEELAWRADMHRTYIADIERGVRNVTLRTVAHLAKALQITVGNLFAYTTARPGTRLRVGAATAPTEVQDILLVDHNAGDAAMTARAFKWAKLRIVHDAEAGLDSLFGTGRYARRKPVRPQLIMLGPNLPQMSGLEFLRRVKADERTRDIPVVILTVSE
ncbi:MAG: helix-turn-helix domain-containing protein [Opitutaceae bacterium]|nr:helix-turn-helix domain-containing protein [Opitutaceae bacterium]